MVIKNKKTKVKSKEIEKKVDLQNPQENISDSSKDNEEKLKEIKTEESDVVEGMVYCKNCKGEVEPYPAGHNRWRCPGCQKYTQSPVMDESNKENVKEIKSSKDRPYQILSSRNTKFSGSELAQAEMLIESGVAKDFNDLARKAFNLLFLKEKLNKAFGIDTNKMELNENNPKEENVPDPKRTMKELQEQKMMENYITGMKGNPSDTLKQLQEQKLVESYIKNMDKGEQMDPIQMMMVMRMMENQGTGKENGFMDKMMQIQMMKSMQGGNQDSGVSRELADLKSQIAMNQLLQQANQKNAPTMQENMASLEKIRADRDVRIKQAEMEAQKYRDQSLKATMDSKLQELERQIDVAKQTGGTLGAQRINEMKEEFKAIREMSAMLGDKEKGTGEAMMESIGTIAEKALPSLIELGKQKRQQPIAPTYQQPQEFLPSQGQPILSQGTPTPQSPDKVPSETDMAKIRDEMYLNPPPLEET